MVETIFYDKARKSILDFFSLEFPDLALNEIETFIGFFYQMTNYEEEGTKIRPKIYICDNVNALTKLVPDCYKLAIYTDENSSMFKQRLRALMRFCGINWSIYINYGENKVEYGLINVVNSIKDKTLDQFIFSQELQESIAKKTYLIKVDVVSAGLCLLQGAEGHTTNICFSLNNQLEINWEMAIKDFINASVSKLRTTKKKLDDIKNLYFNIYQRVFRNIHGTICLVVDKDYVDKNGYLSDGTWLKEPIEFGKLFLQSKHYSEAKLMSYADLFTTMLNYDGITVVDTAGRIRAYNVFVENSRTAAKKVLGGARRRAAHTLLESKNKKIIGVYFQSQDGDNFFKYTSVNLTRQQKLLQNKRAKESASMVPLAELIKINEEDLGKDATKEKDILKDVKLEETTHEKAAEKVDNDKEHAAEQKTESVVKNANSVVVPDKNDGVTTKSKVYVEYIDISKENK
ncbi:MAG: hypothetical protein J6V40_03035 [Clostridia bacterium]|nr:hypothetical protein [Clostridia bacterium]